jgi:anti-anti-sigma regulatory factor
MVHVNVEKLGRLRVVECDGRIVRSDSAFALRDCVTSQSDARVIVLDLSEVNAIEGGGLGMLMFLQRWAQDHDIRLKLFNPRISVLARLELNGPTSPFDIVSLEELLDLLGQADQGYHLAA